MTPKKSDGALFLGLDIGTNSVGWALLESGKAIKAAGVRVFEAGTTGTADQIAVGKDEPRNQARRQARQSRRSTWRRGRRLQSLFTLLVNSGLLPKPASKDPEDRNKMFDGLDGSLSVAHLPAGDSRVAHLLPYFLRARALDEKLEPHALGRAIYHLAQRRGFLSNRKSAPKDDEDLGKVKSGISELAQKMEETGSRTLGEYFLKVDPETQRIRCRWTGRNMFQEEFEKVWSVQAAYHPEILTPDLKKKIHRAMFFQRPLKSQKHLIGHCSLEQRSRRAAWPLLLVQRFRMLQRLNDLRVMADGEFRKLTEAERETLLTALALEGDRTFIQVRSLLGLPKGSKFNLEEGEEKKIPGDRTSSALKKALGIKFDDFSQDDREELVQYLMSIQDDSAFIRKVAKRWSLSAGTAHELSRIGLQDGYCSLSAKAIGKLLPLLEEGISFAEAKKTLYPGSAVTKEAFDVLPAPPELRNPIVQRALSQVRKLVNSVATQYGKPDKIRVELARDLKRPRKMRAEISKNNRALQKQREDAYTKIIKEGGIKEPKRADIEKALLWEECQNICPYTGASIAFGSLFGPAAQFDIEHIIPFSRSLDDSFMNKTLCHAETNRNLKKNKTPFEAFGADEKAWSEIVGRVKRFKGRAKVQKLRRFKMTPEEVQEAFENFSARHLQDTRYASLEASRYLGSLYGCREDLAGVDKTGTRRIQVSSGQVTAILRNEWGLNRILNDGGDKTRDDHRHHAVDAITTALADDRVIKQLSDAASSAPQAKRRRFAPLTLPWPSLLEDAKAAVGGILASHAPTRKVSGPLHEETLYSPPKVDAEGKTWVHVRKPLGEKFSAKLIETIVDSAVRESVREHFKSNGGDSKKAFGNPENLPTLKFPSGKVTPIRKVRVRISQASVPLGSGARKRHVMTGSNSHMEIFESKGKSGKVQWEGRVVTLLEAMGRIRAKVPIVNREWEGKRFVCSLMGGDCFRMGKDGEEQYYRVRMLTMARQGKNEYGQIACAPINDARTIDAMKKDGVFQRLTVEPLRKKSLQKVAFTLTGEVRRAND